MKKNTVVSTYVTCCRVAERRKPMRFRLRLPINSCGEVRHLEKLSTTAFSLHTGANTHTIIHTPSSFSPFFFVYIFLFSFSFFPSFFSVLSFRKAPATVHLELTALTAKMFSCSCFSFSGGMKTQYSVPLPFLRVSLLMKARTQTHTYTKIGPVTLTASQVL